MRVKVHVVDRDRFEAVYWGSIENGEIVEESDELPQGQLENYLEFQRGFFDVSDELRWLFVGRSFGSQAQRPKVYVEHPAIDRVLEYPEAPLVCVLRGLDHEGSKFDCVWELSLEDEERPTKSCYQNCTVVLRYQLPLTNGREYDREVALQTACNVINEVTACFEYPQHYIGAQFERILICGYAYSQQRWIVSVEASQLADAKQNFSPGELEDVATIHDWVFIE